MPTYNHNTEPYTGSKSYTYLAETWKLKRLHDGKSFSSESLHDQPTGWVVKTRKTMHITRHPDKRDPKQGDIRTTSVKTVKEREGFWSWGSVKLMDPVTAGTYDPPSEAELRAGVHPVFCWATKDEELDGGCTIVPSRFTCTAGKDDSNQLLSPDRWMEITDQRFGGHSSIFGTEPQVLDWKEMPYKSNEVDGHRFEHQFLESKRQDRNGRETHLIARSVKTFLHDKETDILKTHPDLRWTTVSDGEKSAEIQGLSTSDPRSDGGKALSRFDSLDLDGKGSSVRCWEAAAALEDAVDAAIEPIMRGMPIKFYRRWLGGGTWNDKLGQIVSEQAALIRNNPECKNLETRQMSWVEFEQVFPCYKKDVKLPDGREKHSSAEYKKTIPLSAD